GLARIHAGSFWPETSIRRALGTDTGNRFSLAFPRFTRFLCRAHVSIVARDSVLFGLYWGALASARITLARGLTLIRRSQARNRICPFTEPVLANVRLRAEVAIIARGTGVERARTRSGSTCEHRTAITGAGGASRVAADIIYTKATPAVGMSSAQHAVVKQ